MRRKATNKNNMSLGDLMLTELASKLTLKYESVWPDQYVNNVTKKQYTPHNKDESDFVFTDTPRYFLCKGGEGSGKRLSVDTLVPTPNGYTTMGRIEVGDVVFDENGNTCNVTSRSGVVLRSDAFDIQFDTGERLTACAEHQWYVFNGSSFAIYTTMEMYEAINDEEKPLSFSIPLPKPIGIEKDNGQKYEGSVFKRYIPHFILREPYSIRRSFLEKFWELHVEEDRKGVGKFVFGSEDQALVFFELLNTLSIKANLPIESKALRERYVSKNLPLECPEISTSEKKIVSIKQHNKPVLMQCISVDSPNKLYLVGRGHIVTHNSVAGIIKTLNKLKRGLPGALLGPSLPHFKKSIWPEFTKWVPEEAIVPEHRYKLLPKWEGMENFFTLLFISQKGETVPLYCGGIDNPFGWEGPNLNFIHLDEAQVLRNSSVLEVLAGRIRLEGPDKIPPQLYITSLPNKNWLFDFFGPIEDKEGEEDPHRSFKELSKTITLKTKDNIANLDADYVNARSTTLSESERLRRMEAEWIGKSDSMRFVPDMVLWDKLYDNKIVHNKVDKSFTMVLALDAGVSRDYFAMVGVSRNPDPKKFDSDIVVRYSRVWRPQDNSRGIIDFVGTPDNPGPEIMIRELCKLGNVVQVVYDPFQLHYMANRLYDEALAWFEPVNQNTHRDMSDKCLYDLIIQEKITHGGDKTLRKNIDNADKRTINDGKLRIIKRSDNLKIDLAVALGMACYKCLQLNL